MKQKTISEMRDYFFKGISLFKHSRKVLWISMILTLLIQASALFETHILAKITDSLYQRNDGQFYIMLVVTAVVGLGTILISIISAKLDMRIRLQVVTDLKERALRMICSRKEIVDDFSEGEQYSIIQEDSEAVVSYVYKIISYAFSFCVLVYIGATLIRISPAWAGIFAGIQVIIGFVQKKGVEPVRMCAKECLKSENEFQKYLNEELSEMHAIRYENMKEDVVSFARKNLEGIKSKRILQNNETVRVSTLSKSCMYAGKMLLFLGMGREVLLGKVSMQEYIIFYSYMSMFSGHFMSVIQMMTVLQPLLLNVKRLVMLLEQESERKGKEPAWEILSFSNMKKCFGDKVLFDDVNFKMQLKNSYAVLGVNGSGKTTFSKMLLGEETVSGGKLFIDGISTANLGRESLTGIRYFAANPCVLSGMSVKENLLLGVSDIGISEESLVEACEDFMLLEDIKEMKSGMETILGKEVCLSSGQKKKVELIRAALSDAEVIILDEPLANLDEEFRKRFHRIFRKYYQDRKIIIVEHDEKRVSYVDYILTIADGKLRMAG